jgi:Ca2+-binding RTX toxin-like protein
LLDIVAVENGKGNNITLDDLLAGNPNITNANQVQAGVSIFIPQRTGNELNLFYANGVSINQNSSTNEYYMIVPHNDGTGSISIFEKKSDGTGGFNIRQTVSDGNGEVVSEFVGSQTASGMPVVSKTFTERLYDENGNLLLSSELNEAGAYSDGALSYSLDQTRYVDGQIQSFSVTRLDATGRLVQTVEREVSGHLIKVEFVEDEWGEMRATRVLLVDGIPPASATPFAGGLDDQGYNSWEFAEGVAEDAGAATLEEIFQRNNPNQVSGLDTLLNGIATYGPSVIDALALIKAIQNGEPLPIVASGLRLAAGIDLVNGGGINTNLAGASSIASGVLSLMSLDAALERGDTFGAITAGAQAINFGAQAYATFANTQGLVGQQAVVEVFGANSAFAQLGEALPVLSLINSIVQGDAVGAAISVAYMINPVVGVVLSVVNLLVSLFDSDEIPDPWGSGQFVWNGNGISYQSIGETGGDEAVSNVMDSVLSTMNALIERERQQNPGSQLGLIPQRMPSVGYDMSGYRYTDIDPLTGAEQHPTLRFDTSGNPYNAEAGSPESFQSIIEGMVYSALSRQAIAPLWEVLTARAQADAGDPKAGLTEEERAGRDGQLAAPITGTTQTFRPVVLDMDGDGIETVNKAASGVAFDVDDSGFMKQTGWATGGDAFLTLDRDYNGETNTSREMFSNSVVDISRRGLAGMAWVDSNYDGKLTAADPVWNELKVWQDDGDGVDEAGEKQALSDLGITELNYSMGTFTQNGQVKQLASPDLEADKDGTRINIVPEGILVQSSGSDQISLLVTRIDDLTAVEANRDGVTSFEDVETIIGGADLLANDTLGGFTGRDLSITGLTNLRHGTGFIDVNGFVHFNPEANYAGTDAGFDYTVLAVNGQTGTGGVDINLQNVNDAPTLDHVDHSTQAVYGYTPVQYDENGSYQSGGQPIYQPYAISRDWDGNETYVYNPPPGQGGYEYHTTPVGNEDTGAGRVAGADIDDPATSLSYEIVNQPQYGAVSLNADGSFQYTSWKEPGVASDRIVVDGQYGSTKDGTLYTQSNLPGSAVYPTSDIFQVKITDPSGASTTQNISVLHFGPYLPPTPPGGGGKKPIAIDLNGNGFEFINVNDSNVFFDVNGDGWKRRTAWVAPGDGLLAYDIDGDGKIDKAGEISFAQYKNGAQSDLEGLTAFDTNGDGRFTAADDAWTRFGVWQDSNQNGITDAGEFKSLDAMGVNAVELTGDGQFAVVNGQTVHGIGSMEKIDGSRLAIADVTLAYSNETQIPQPDGSTVSVTPASPFSPNGELLEGTPDKDLILGKNGNNIVKAYAGDDVIFEDGGNDIIDAGDGNDIVYSGADNDLVMGGGGDDAIYAGLGSDVVFGGDGHDAIFAEGGNDVVFGGAGNDLIAGGWGNDVLSGDDGDDQVYGESGNDALFGRDGNDELAGMDGNDLLNGGLGNDLLDGGAGDDEMTGGAGDDTYVVDSAADTVIELAGEGVDTVKSTIDYTLANTLENLALTGTSAVQGMGNAQDNVVTGNGAANVLAGLDGNDRLDGRAGADTLIGGAGDDVYIVDNAGDTVQELAGEGRDTVYASVSTVLSENVEDLTLTGLASTNATGNALDNRLTGNRGDNLQDGGVGADVMTGGLGNDTYVVEDAADQTLEFAGEGVDTVQASLSWTLAENIENLILTGTADIDGSGNTLDNILIGNSGANRLDGGLGADTLAGGAGDDTYIVDHAGDSVIEQVDEGIDSVLADVSYALSANMENLALTGTGDTSATGNGLDNVLTGNAGDNLLNGGAGADTMAGGAGNDGYVVDNLGDTVTEMADAGIDSVFSSVSFVLPEHVEHLTLTGESVIDGTGNALDNILIGNEAANQLTGADGNDQLSGNGGDDVLNGGIGADHMSGGMGDDLYYVDDALDVVEEVADGGYDTVRTSISLTAPAYVERIELLGVDNLDATGNELDNALLGNSGANRLDGALGADAMAGAAGDDVYIVDNAGDTVVEAADEGNDLVFASVTTTLSDHVEQLTLTGTADINATGNALDNVLNGNAGSNKLDGGAGADTMAGGAGDDNYWVDNAADTVFEAMNEGIDSIYTQVSYVLPEHVENLYLIGDGSISAGGNGADNVLIGNSGDNHITGGAGNDALNGMGGNDTLDGGTGNDVLIGGDGNDTYLINLGDGLDRVDEVAGVDTTRFGDGLSLDNVALRVTQGNDGYTAHVRVLNAGGCEQADQGFDFAVPIDSQGRYVSPIERFQFADGSIKSFDDLLIKTVTTIGTSKTREITTGRDDDIIYAGPAANTVHAGTGNDVVYGQQRNDTLYGEGGDDYLAGNEGNDVLDGGCGVDILSGGKGDDVLRDAGGGNAALLGGHGRDTITGGAGSDFIAGGKHDDVLDGGAGYNVFAFGEENGRDVILPALGASNTLSLGDVEYDDLKFRKAGTDLVLENDSDSSITFKGWYADAANRNFTTLQVVAELDDDDDHEHHEQHDDDAPPFTAAVETFDFQELVGQFDQAQAANPRLSRWSLMNGLLDAHLASSDSMALGGDLALHYAQEGELKGMALLSAQNVLKDPGFGAQAQVVHPWSSLEGGAVKVA